MAMDADGDFVVAWASDGQDGDGRGIYAPRYNAVVPAGPEFQVNPSTGRGRTAQYGSCRQRDGRGCRSRRASMFQAIPNLLRKRMARCCAYQVRLARLTLWRRFLFPSGIVHLLRLG